MVVTTNFEIWAQLVLSDKDIKRLREFFIKEIGVYPKFVTQNLHLAIYNARRPMLGVTPVVKDIKIVLPSAESRFMVMSPGGKNPRPDIDPRKHKIGIRVHRRSSILTAIMELREGLTRYETQSVLGKRKPVTRIEMLLVQDIFNHILLC